MASDALYLTSNMRNARKTSQGEMEWLLYLAQTRDIRSQYTSAEGQKFVPPYHLDGYEERKDGTKVAYEFLGCLFHGHCVLDPSCPVSVHLNASQPSIYGEPMHMVYRKWLEKKDYLIKQGIKVEWMWECEFKKMKQDKPEVASFVKKLYAGGRPKERLTLRDGLRGGRSEAYCLYFEETAKDAEKYEMLYMDVNSLGRISYNFRNVQYM